MAFLFGCSTASVKEVRLSDGKTGFDLNCLGGKTKCQERARVLCDGKYRVHHFYDNDISSYTIEKGLVMRLECLQESAQVLKECSEPGVNCYL